MRGFRRSIRTEACMSPATPGPASCTAERRTFQLSTRFKSLNSATRQVRLLWQTDVFATWHYQIIAYNVTNLATFEVDFFASDGPSGNPSLFHIIDFGEAGFIPGTADYFAGTADFTMPSDGDYVFFIRGVPWMEPFTPGEYAVSRVITFRGRVKGEE